MIRFCLIAIACVAALCTIGCGPSFQLRTPPGFVELDEDHSAYDYRATTADGLVVAVRQIEHDPKGDLTFWLKAIENQMRERGGYALLETKDVRSADGVAGKQLRFGHDDESNEPHLYYLSIFVTDESIFVVEAGGTKELVTRHGAQLDGVLRGFRTE